MQTFTVRSKKHEELIDITDRVREIITAQNIFCGTCHIYTPHTTAAITINENADPDVRRDILKGLAGLGLEKIQFSHQEGNSPAHIKSSIIGCSEIIFIEEGAILMGTWQGIFFCEFDGPRTRKVLVKIIGQNPSFRT